MLQGDYVEKCYVKLLTVTSIKAVKCILPLLFDSERRLCLFERKVLRCIFGAKQENGIWRKRYNHELYELFKDSDIVNYIKVKRLAWAGHLTRMSNERTLKKIFNTRPEGTRSVGRPKLRWEDGVVQDT